MSGPAERNPDLTPTPAVPSVPAPAAGGGTVPAGPALTVGYALAALVCAGAAWWSAVRGVATDSWPPFAPGTDATLITRYSGAWLTAAAGAALVAALLLVAVVRRLLRRRSPHGRPPGETQP